MPPSVIPIWIFDADILIVLLKPIDESMHLNKARRKHQYTFCTSTAHDTLVLFLSYLAYYEIILMRDGCNYTISICLVLMLICSNKVRISIALRM